MKLSISIKLIILLLSFQSIGQNAQTYLAKLKQNSKAMITLNNSNGLAEFVRFPVGSAMALNGSTLQQKAFSFLQEYKEIFDIVSVDQTLLFDKIETDNYGLNCVILKQVYNGIPVFDGQLRFHFNKEDKLTAINGNYISGITKLNQSPVLSVNRASEVALSAINDQDLNFSGRPLFAYSNKLFVFPKGLIQQELVSTYLVYEVEIRNELDVREFVYVDAHSGNIVEQFTGIAHALDREIYENNTSNLVWEEGNVFPGSLTIWQRNEVETSGHIYNFFKNAFNYISYDGADITMRTINNNPNISCPNATWNGSTANFCNGTASDDVVAHEWGHAYTQFTSGLIYAYQSGAINEAYSDIWGETVDVLNSYEDDGENLAVRTSAACNSDRWKIGEDASAFSGAIRDMWNPPCNGNPGKVTDIQYSCGDFDSGGVHINSGVPNHAYALLVDGGSYNGQVVDAIGFTKVAHIFWRAQNVYLTPTSNFVDLADALEAACTDLLGINLQGLSTTSTPAGASGQILTMADYENVTRAILAVEMRVNPDICGYQPILAATPPLCEASTSNPLYVEDWESGTGSWTVAELPTNISTWEPRNWTISNTLPSGRSGHAIFAPNPINGNCNTDLENGIIRLQSPVIAMPNITTGTFDMAFNHYIATELNWDGGNIKYSLNGGPWTILPTNAFLNNPYNSVINTIIQGNDNPMQGQVAFTGTDGGSVTSSWGQSIINLSALGVIANSNIQFRFEFGSDGCNGNDGWYIDEIVIYNCSATLSVTDSNYLEAGVKVFPNPSNGSFTLKKLKNIELVAAEIFDINGRSIMNIDLSAMQTEKVLDISSFTSGIYFMSVISKDSKSTIKLIKE